MRAAAGLMLLALALAGCTPFKPAPEDAQGFRERIQWQAYAPLKVGATVLSDAEAHTYFGVDLASQGIQPVWITLENQSNNPAYLLPIFTDQNYFSADEVAWRFKRSLTGNDYEALRHALLQGLMPREIDGQTQREGFIFTNHRTGAKYYQVGIADHRGLHRFEFAQDIPGVIADYHQRDLSKLNLQPIQLSRLLDKLNSLPCCVLGPDLSSPGDPLNLVIIAHADVFHLPFLQRGWHITETLSGSSAWRTAKSSLLNQRYDTSPVSPLFLFGRSQDLALQKARSSVDERNHLRLWLSPWQIDGRDVWIGQISRDIGIKLSTRTLITHKIDPDVDEARDYLFSDLLLSSRLAAFGYAEKPNGLDGARQGINFTQDPYHSDGHWVVLQLSRERIPEQEVVEIDFRTAAPDQP